MGQIVIFNCNILKTLLKSAHFSIRAVFEAFQKDVVGSYGNESADFFIYYIDFEWNHIIVLLISEISAHLSSICELTEKYQPKTSVGRKNEI